MNYIVLVCTCVMCVRCVSWIQYCNRLNSRHDNINDNIIIICAIWIHRCICNNDWCITCISVPIQFNSIQHNTTNVENISAMYMIHVINDYACIVICMMIELYDAANRLLNITKDYNISQTNRNNHTFHSYIKQYHNLYSSNVTRPSTYQLLLYAHILCAIIRSHSIWSNTHIQTLQSIPNPTQKDMDEIYGLYMSLLHSMLCLTVNEYHVLSHYIDELLSPFIESNKIYIQSEYDMGIYQAIVAVKQWYNTVSISSNQYNVDTVLQSNESNTPYTLPCTQLARISHINITHGFHHQYLASMLLHHRHTINDTKAKQLLYHYDAYLHHSSLHTNTHHTYCITQSSTNRKYSPCACSNYMTDNYNLPQSSMHTNIPLSQSHTDSNRSPFAGMPIEAVYQALFANQQMHTTQLSTQPSLQMQQPNHGLSFQPHLLPQQYAHSLQPIPYPNNHSQLSAPYAIPQNSTIMPTQSMLNHYFDVPSTTLQHPSLPHSYLTVPPPIDQANSLSADDTDSTAQSTNHNSQHHLLSSTNTSIAHPPHSQSHSNPLPSKHRVARTKRGKTLPNTAVEYMQKWLLANYAHPYPTEQDKQSIADHCSLTPKQVNYWFINARARKIRRNAHNHQQSHLRSHHINHAAQQHSTVVQPKFINTNKSADT